MWSYKPPFYAIDEHFERADGPILPVGQSSVDRIALYHYVVKCAQLTVQGLGHDQMLDRSRGPLAGVSRRARQFRLPLSPAVQNMQAPVQLAGLRITGMLQCEIPVSCLSVLLVALLTLRYHEAAQPDGVVPKPI